MDPDVRMDHPGKCPRCGMTLALGIPDRLEYTVSLDVQPRDIKPGDEARFTLQIIDPAGNQVTDFATVHEKLMHSFLVSEDLEFFAHVHPTNRSDGSFTLTVRLPKPGMYRLLSDYYPSQSVPQLSVNTFYIEGQSRSPHLQASLNPQHAANLTASLRLEPETLVAGQESKLYYSLEPGEGLERYLGTWGHMLVASEDAIDLMHLHPFLREGSQIQYNIIFPRPGKYKIWSQFQRLGAVNTVAFCVSLTEL